MTDSELRALRYPIGKAELQKALSPEQRTAFTQVLANFPGELAISLQGISEAQFDTPYRPGGWTVRQLVHHVADSHMNAYIRFRWTLTEDKPTIKTYDQVKWAELPDAKTAPADISIALIANLHVRWVRMLQAMTPEDFQTPFHHPEWGEINLDQMLCLYEWHCRHHLAHIRNHLTRKGWLRASSS